MIEAACATTLRKMWFMLNDSDASDSDDADEHKHDFCGGGIVGETVVVQEVVGAVHKPSEYIIHFGSTSAFTLSWSGGCGCRPKTLMCPCLLQHLP
eukprot:1714135-Amphidinium_carterae.1